MADRPTPNATRREEVPARMIRLADGNYWGFARPTVRLTPMVATDLDRLGRKVEHVTVAIGFGYPPMIERLIDGVRSTCDRGSVSQQYETFFSLAAALLHRSHDLSREAACELLAVSEDELFRLVREVMAVALEEECTSEKIIAEVPALE
jgi:hypothetical protein